MHHNTEELQDVLLEESVPQDEGRRPKAETELDAGRHVAGRAREEAHERWHR